MKKIIIVALCLFNYAYAENAPKNFNLTRANAVSIALANSPQLRAVKTSIDASQGRFEQAGSLDNPSLGLSYGNDFLFGNEGEDAFELSISQKFPLFGRLSKEKDIAKIDIELASLEYRQAQRDLALGVELAFIDNLKIQEKLANKMAQLSLIKDMKEALKASLSRAEISALDCLSIKNQYEALAVEIEQDKINAEVSLLELRALLAIDCEKPISFAETLVAISPSDAKFSKSVLDSRLDYQIILNSKESVRAQIALINAEKFEDIEVGIFVETSMSCDVPVGLKRESAIGISLSIPLPIKSFSGSLNEKLAMRRQIDELALEKEIRIKNELRIYSLQALRLQEVLKQNEDTLLKESQSVCDKYLLAYKNAQVSLNEVFSVLKEHLALLDANIDIKAQQATNAIKLNYSLGIFENEK